MIIYKLFTHYRNLDGDYVAVEKQPNTKIAHDEATLENDIKTTLANLKKLYPNYAALQPYIFIPKVCKWQRLGTYYAENDEFYPSTWYDDHPLFLKKLETLGQKIEGKFLEQL